MMLDHSDDNLKQKCIENILYLLFLPKKMLPRKFQNKIGSSCKFLVILCFVFFLKNNKCFIFAFFQTSGVVSDVKFSKNREKQKKNYGKTGIFTQNQFSTGSIFLYGCNSKTNHCKYLKFSPNVYVSVIYIQPLKFSIFMRIFFFEVSFKFLRNLSKTRKFAKKTRSIIIGKILSAFEF
ncbi:hypothetical protein AGLY_005576 [Aphis glycines]|uniref:Uncharacterized protein n=1 Tax=Aphis glycines TaxID=307491 RepID=A0A6G0TVJ1_APHGL|nr:hypothetical protein AGLY_005576 [Aphis glycines]